MTPPVLMKHPLRANGWMNNMGPGLLVYIYLIHHHKCCNLIYTVFYILIYTLLYASLSPGHCAVEEGPSHWSTVLSLQTCKAADWKGIWRCCRPEARKEQSSECLKPAICEEREDKYSTYLNKLGNHFFLSKLVKKLMLNKFFFLSYLTC